MGIPNMGKMEPESAAVVRQLTAGNSEVLDHRDMSRLRAKMSLFMRECAPKPLPIKGSQKYLVRGRDGNVPIIVYWPRLHGSGSPDAVLPMLLYFHGGGYTHFSAETHDPVARYLCGKGSCIVVNVDYRLAPEHKFPTPIDDAYAVLSWAASHAKELGGDPTKIAVGGESAGGTISIALCLLTKQENGPEIALQIPMCPALTMDVNQNYQSWITLGGGEYLLTPRAIEDIVLLYLREPSERFNPLASPILATNLSGLPPALILTAEFDPLVDEAEHYAQRLKSAGLPVTYKCFPGTIHSFMIMAGLITLGYSALDFVADRVAAL